MKALLTLATILTAIPAFAETSTLQVQCTGANEKGSVKIEVATSQDASKLLVTMYPTNRAPNRFDVREYAVTDSRAMFPISSIKAASDARPVDGALTEANLAISTEVARPAQGMPATLTLSSTFYDRRAGKEVTTTQKYALSCMIAR